MEDVNLNIPIFEDETFSLAREVREELDYDRQFLRDLWKRDSKRLNADQKRAFTRIVDSLEKKNGRCFFIDAPGGSFFCLSPYTSRFFSNSLQIFAKKIYNHVDIFL